MIHTWREAANILRRTTNNSGTMTGSTAYEHGQEFHKQKRKVLVLSMCSMQKQEHFSTMTLSI